MNSKIERSLAFEQHFNYMSSIPLTLIYVASVVLFYSYRQSCHDKDTILLNRDIYKAELGETKQLDNIQPKECPKNDIVVKEQKSPTKRFPLPYHVNRFKKDLYDTTDLSYSDVDKIYESEKIYRRFLEKDSDEEFFQIYPNKRIRGIERHHNVTIDDYNVYTEEMARNHVIFYEDKYRQVDISSIEIFQEPHCELTFDEHPYRVFIKTIFGTEQGERQCAIIWDYLFEAPCGWALPKYC